MRVPISVYIALALAEMAARVTVRRALITLAIVFIAWRLI